MPTDLFIGIPIDIDHTRLYYYYYWYSWNEIHYDEVHFFFNLSIYLVLP